MSTPLLEQVHAALGTVIDPEIKRPITDLGMVESVDSDGKIHTVEGNSSNMVTRRVHDATGDGATGFVHIG